MVGFGFNFAFLCTYCLSIFLDLIAKKRLKIQYIVAVGQDLRGSNGEVEGDAARKNLSHT